MPLVRRSLNLLQKTLKSAGPYETEPPDAEVPGSPETLAAADAGAQRDPSTQHRKEFGSDQDFDAAGDSRLPPDQPGSLEGEDHLVDGGWSDTEMSLQVGFGGRPAEHARICIDEGQILTLLGREVWSGGQGQHRF